MALPEPRVCRMMEKKMETTIVFGALGSRPREYVEQLPSGLLLGVSLSYSFFGVQVDSL